MAGGWAAWGRPETAPRAGFHLRISGSRARPRQTAARMTPRARDPAFQVAGAAELRCAVATPGRPRLGRATFVPKSACTAAARPFAPEGGVLAKQVVYALCARSACGRASERQLALPPAPRSELEILIVQGRQVQSLKANFNSPAPLGNRFAPGCSGCCRAAARGGFTPEPPRLLHSGGPRRAAVGVLFLHESCGEHLQVKRARGHDGDARGCVELEAVDGAGDAQRRASRPLWGGGNVLVKVRVEAKRVRPLHAARGHALRRDVFNVAHLQLALHVRAASRRRKHRASPAEESKLYAVHGHALA
mmetsp:Transcript_5566/g.23604  ORF Transcript_5566/g.23604 Transcript_5566/m.23604 type:complete len:305 (-) Transcript_5566:360-1274(-)